MDSEAIADRGKIIGEEFIQLGNVDKYLKDKNLFKFFCGKTIVFVKVLADDIIRLVMKPYETPSLDTTKGVIFDGDTCVECTSCELDNKVIIKTGILEVHIGKFPFHMEIYGPDGDSFFKTHDSYSLGWSERRTSCRIAIRDEEHFYGLGEKCGWLDKRGENVSMWNTDMFDPHNQHTKELYVSIPFYIGLSKGKSYGLLLDNPSRTHFNMGEGQDEYAYLETEAGKFDFYVIYGPQIKRVVSRYTDLTGKMHLPPMWSLGYQQEKYSYATEEEVRYIAGNFRKRGIPCDTIYIDIHHMDDYRCFTWNYHRFPDPEKLIADLKEDGFHSIITVNPGVKKDPEYEHYIDGMKRGYFCKKLDGSVFVGKVWPGDSVYPDFSKAEVRKWWSEKHKIITDKGIEGIWNDMNEPSVFRPVKNGSLEDHTMDLDVMHENDGNPATHRELHNLYGLLMVMSTYDGLKESLKGKRPFILSRSGYPGIQRYAAVWTGDNRSFWEHLSMGIPMLLNMGLSGMPFVGNDLGGYMGNSNGELFTRWVQFGVFAPFFRTCYSINLLPQEPWSYGEKYERIVKDFIRLRYRLLAHIYNLFYEASVTGIPVMRPLVLEYQDDPEVYNVSDEFLLGNSILVAPICKPDSEYREIYLPDGIWYDFYTGERHIGGKYMLGYAPIDRIPLFVKQGSIIPMIDCQSYVGEKKLTSLELEIYPGAECEYVLYEDDGETFAYEQGEYSITNFNCRIDGNNLLFEVSPEKSDYRNTRERYLLKFRCIQKSSKVVKVNGEIIAEKKSAGGADCNNFWYFDENEKAIYVQISDSKTKTDHVFLEF